jgi:hypothetical protein
VRRETDTSPTPSSLLGHLELAIPQGYYIWAVLTLYQARVFKNEDCITPCIQRFSSWDESTVQIGFISRGAPRWSRNSATP